MWKRDVKMPSFWFALSKVLVFFIIPSSLFWVFAIASTWQSCWQSTRSLCPSCRFCPYAAACWIKVSALLCLFLLSWVFEVWVFRFVWVHWVCHLVGRKSLYFCGKSLVRSMVFELCWWFGCVCWRISTWTLFYVPNAYFDVFMIILG